MIQRTTSQIYLVICRYCFGGQACLEQVRNGDNLQAVVSFHGLLHSHPGVKDESSARGWGDRLTKAEFESQIDTAPNSYNSDCKVLIENGDLDTSVPQEVRPTFFSFSYNFFF